MHAMIQPHGLKGGLWSTLLQRPMQLCSHLITDILVIIDRRSNWNFLLAIFVFQTFFERFRNASFENLEYLTVEQSLADIATFIRFIRTDPSIGYFTKVILWGSGYGGSVAVWARKNYPGLIDGVRNSCNLFGSEIVNLLKHLGVVVQWNIRHQLVQFQWVSNRSIFNIPSKFNRTITQVSTTHWKTFYVVLQVVNVQTYYELHYLKLKD